MSETKLVGGLPQRVAAQTIPMPSRAELIEPDLTEDERLVLIFVSGSPNCSRHEIASNLRLSPTQCEAAIRLLEKKGRIEYTGDESKKSH